MQATPISGCFEIRPRIFDDDRGRRFVKVFHEELLRLAVLETVYAEEYYSVSRRGVIRGLHFQVPPMDHVKLVYCVAGRVQDAVVDLRVGSPSFGCYALIELNADIANMVYIPKGIAHGFCVLSDTATLVYKVSTVYSARHDAGVLWSSAGIPWAVTDPVLSERDQSHLPLDQYESPFVYEGEEVRS
ncbi:MAG: dTDP-4-dehydrorhamnose 3,5-epimerase family protein [Candidatus Competibacteraceae bacterium]|nr:dTDP-4-dehydrorhamnose 3,5-epimerase family protein [Candidatus Competibacteraceae bacterium]